MVTILVRELNTAGQVATDKSSGTIRPKRSDDANVGFDYPMVVPASGREYSYEKVLRLYLVSGDFTTVSNLRMHTDGASGFGTDRKLWVLSAASFSAPVIPSNANSPPQHASTPLVDAFTYTAASPLSIDTFNTGPFDATGLPKYIGDYIILVAEAGSAAPPGVTSSETLTFTYDVSGIGTTDRTASSFADVSVVVESNIYTLDTDGMILHDGGRMFPLGMYIGTAYQSNLPSIAGHFDTGLYVEYGGTTSTPAYIAATQALGMRCCLGIARDEFEGQTSGYRDTWFSNWWATIGSSKNVITYFNLDEGYYTGVSQADLLDIYARYKAHSSNHVVVFTEFTVAGANHGAGAFDVFNYDGYPLGTSYAGTIEDFRGAFRSIQSAVSPKPMWLTFQTFYTADLRWVKPTATEMRIMAYIGLSNKARALISFTWHFTDFDFSNDAPFLAEVNALFDELKSFQWLFTQRDSVTVTASTTAEIDILVKGDGNEAYLICANYASGTWDGYRAPGVAQNNAVINLTGFAAGTYQGIAPATGATQFSGSSFTVSFPAYQAQIYRLLP